MRSQGRLAPGAPWHTWKTARAAYLREKFRAEWQRISKVSNGCEQHCVMSARVEIFVRAHHRQASALRGSETCLIVSRNCSGAPLQLVGCKLTAGMSMNATTFEACP